MSGVKPRICLLTETYYPQVGGGETQARMLAEGLVERGFGVMVVTRRSDKASARREMYGEIVVYRLPPSGRQRFKKWGLLLTAAWALLKLRRDYDLLFVSGFRLLGLPSLLTSRLLGKVCILKADSQGEMSGAYFAGGLAQLGLTPAFVFFRLFLWLRNKRLRRADAFVAISSEIAAELTGGGVNPDRIHFIPNGVQPGRFHPVAGDVKQALRGRLALPADGTIVIYTGRLVAYKGLPLLLRVWQTIAPQYERALLLLVGAGGLDIDNCEAELKQFVRANGLETRVRFTGEVSNVHEYLQAADIFAFPTENEAFGIALIEAMACRLAVIGAAVGGVRDILQDGHNGLMVPPGDFEALCGALDSLMGDQALRRRLGAAARQTVQERYAADRVTGQFARLFSESGPPTGYGRNVSEQKGLKGT